MVLSWKGTSAPITFLLKGQGAIPCHAPFSGVPADRTDTDLCEPLWSICLNCQLLKTLEMMHILQAQVCGCISTHPGLSYQKTERETSDTSKSQLNQASWNRTVLKFGSENKLNVRNYLSIHFLDFPLIVRSGKRHFTISLIGFGPVGVSRGARGPFPPNFQNI